MRKPLALLIVSFVLVSNFSLIADAAVKTGASCAKVGLTSTSGGKKFTCVKSGKKFVWNKGVAVAKPTTTPSTQPTNSPAPTTAVTPSTSYPAAPTGFADLIQNYQGISYAAWSKSRAKILQSSKTELTFKLVLGPNSKLSYKNPTEAFDLVSRLYSGYTKTGTLYLVAFNFEDRDWAVKQMDSIIPTAGSRWIYDVACPSKETCIGGGAFANNQNKYMIVETMGLIDENTTTGTLEAHEFTHSVQQMAMDAARPPTEFLSSPWLPNWYWEGQARFAQNAAIWFESFESYMRLKIATSGGLIQNPAFDSKYIEEYFVVNPTKEWGAKHARQRQYDLGAMMIEVLTALKGPDSTMEMWKLAGTGIGLESAFEKVYGTPFKTALPIMSKAIALELGRS